MTVTHDIVLVTSWTISQHPPLKTNSSNSIWQFWVYTCKKCNVCHGTTWYNNYFVARTILPCVCRNPFHWQRLLLENHLYCGRKRKGLEDHSTFGRPSIPSKSVYTHGSLDVSSRGCGAPRINLHLGGCTQMRRDIVQRWWQSIHFHMCWEDVCLRPA